MKQLTFIKPKTLAFWHVPEPRLQGPADALVRPFVAARCDGDSLFLRHDFESWLRLGARLHVVDPLFAEARSDPFHGPFPYGHECVAEVLEVGSDVREHAPGDVVIVPWSVACGSCGRCRHGLGAHCEETATPIAAYGFGQAFGDYGGMVSDLVRVPFADAMLIPVPMNVPPIAIASASDNMPDAYRAVGPQLEHAPGAPVLVIGGAAHSIGLYAVGLAVALGSSRVDYVDSSPERLAIAERLGAHAVERSRRERWFGRRQLHCSEQFPIAVDASGTSSGLHYAIDALAPGGICTALAFYVRNTTPLPLWKMYLKSTTLHVGIASPHAHARRVVELVAQGRFNPLELKPLVGAWDEAESVLLEPATKVILARPRLQAA